MSRILHYFHISHTKAETHANPLESTKAWILEEWEKTDKIIDSLDLPLEQTNIYQDSLSDYSNHGYEVVDLIYPRETALRLLQYYVEQLGSPNTRILLKLVQKGCRLVATEDYIQSAFLALLWREKPPDADLLFKELLDRRDQFIAQRINSTLQSEDTGILFLGKDHQITDKLDEDIEVHHYLNYT